MCEYRVYRKYILECIKRVVRVCGAEARGESDVWRIFDIKSE